MNAPLAPASATPSATTTPGSVSATDPVPRDARILFRQHLSQLATAARMLDGEFDRWLASAFTGRIEGSFERPFFALFAADAFRGTFAPNSEAKRAELRDRAVEIREALSQANEDARRANVSDEDRRALLERHGFTDAFWDQ